MTEFSTTPTMNASKLLKITKKQELKLRLYVINNNTHYFLNRGKLERGFSNSLTVTYSRNNIFSAFSKMAFLFDELIRLRIVGMSNKSDSDELLYILNLIPVNRKIRTFLDWKVFSPEFTKKMSRLFEVRNDLMHNITISDVSYKLEQNLSLSNKKNFQKFSSDMKSGWDELLKIYITVQDKTLEKFISSEKS
ncbi:MAG: hypothetical protein ACW9WZ_02440 [Nitrosopumilus sp.]|jgi:hypothetical protein